MVPEIKERWVAALRSGKYKQGKKQLKANGNLFCCLGVLCDLYVKEGHAEWEKYGAYDVHFVDDHGTSLPESVQEWAGLEYPSDAVQGVLMTMNDSQEANFAEIADYIEENL